MSSAKAAAPLGAAFTLLCLVTGSLWGKPMWGTWWVWDARLTSVLVLFLMYCGVIALWNAIEDPTRAGRSVAVLTLVGSVNIPIIKFSVDWWNTLHQPASVLRMGGPTIDPSMLWPLLIMAVGSTLPVPGPAPRRHAQRDPAPPRPDPRAHGRAARADPPRAVRRGGRRRGMSDLGITRLHPRRLCVAACRGGARGAAVLDTGPSGRRSPGSRRAASAAAPAGAATGGRA